jgi:hypothetical protein
VGLADSGYFNLAAISYQQPTPILATNVRNLNENDNTSRIFFGNYVL